MSKISKFLLLVLLISFSLLVQSCDANESSKYDTVMKEYKGFVSDQKDNLLGICNWLNSEDGYFYVIIKDGKSAIDTNKGTEYNDEQSENNKELIAIMKELNIEELTQEESGEDIILSKSKTFGEKFVMYNLIYHIGELDPSTQSNFVKIADDFYYYYTVGE